MMEFMHHKPLMIAESTFRHRRYTFFAADTASTGANPSGQSHGVLANWSVE